MGGTKHDLKWAYLDGVMDKSDGDKFTEKHLRVLSRGGVQPREHVYCVPGTGDPEGKLPDRVFLYPEKAEFLRSLDFLIMAMPQTASTEGILGEAEFKLLRPHAFLLNPARGPLIQEPALLRALRGGWIAGAAIDTHYYYPLPPSIPYGRCPMSFSHRTLPGPAAVRDSWNGFTTFFGKTSNAGKRADLC
jgi:hypothetical protein